MAEAFFQATAWTMDTPKPYGAFSSGPDCPWCILTFFLPGSSLFRKEKPDRYHSFFYAAYF